MKIILNQDHPRVPVTIERKATPGVNCLVITQGDSEIYLGGSRDVGLFAEALRFALSASL